MSRFIVKLVKIQLITVLILFHTGFISGQGFPRLNGFFRNLFRPFSSNQSNNQGNNGNSYDPNGFPNMDQIQNIPVPNTPCQQNGHNQQMSHNNQGGQRGRPMSNGSRNRSRFPHIHHFLSRFNLTAATEPHKVPGVYGSYPELGYQFAPEKSKRQKMVKIHGMQVIQPMNDKPDYVQDPVTGFMTYMPQRVFE